MKVHLDECRQRPLPCAFDYHCDKPGEKIDCKFQGTRSEFKKHLIDVHGFGLADTGGFDVMVLHPDSRLRNKHRHNYVVTFEDDDDMFVLCLEVPIADNSIEICMLPVALSWDRGDGITLFYGQRKYTELYVLHTYAWSYGRFLEWWRDPKRGGSPENMFGWRVLYNKLPKDTLTMENWHMFASCCVAQGRFDFNDPEPLVNKMAQALVTGINERHKAGAKRKRETDDNDEKDAKDDEKKKEKKARSGDSDADTKETEAETKKKAWFRGLRALDIVAYQQDRVWFPVLVERAAVCDQKDGHWSIYLDVTGVATLTVPCGCLVSDREPALFRSVAPLEDLPDCDLRWANQRTVDRLVRSFVALVGVSRSIDFYDDPVEGPGRWVQATIEDFQGDKNQNVWIKVAEGRSTMYGLWHVLRSGKIAPMGRYTGVDASSSAARRS